MKNSKAHHRGLLQAVAKLTPPASPVAAEHLDAAIAAVAAQQAAHKPRQDDSEAALPPALALAEPLASLGASQHLRSALSPGTALGAISALGQALRIASAWIDRRPSAPLPVIDQMQEAIGALTWLLPVCARPAYAIPGANPNPAATSAALGAIAVLSSPSMPRDAGISAATVLWAALGLPNRAPADHAASIAAVLFPDAAAAPADDRAGPVELALRASGTDTGGVARAWGQGTVLCAVRAVFHALPREVVYARVPGRNGDLLTLGGGAALELALGAMEGARDAQIKFQATWALSAALLSASIAAREGGTAEGVWITRSLR